MTKRVETRFEVQTFIDQLKYAIDDQNVYIEILSNRYVDHQRDKFYTNAYTLSFLFGDEERVEVIKRELAQLRIDNYIETVKDNRYPMRGEMRVFGMFYQSLGVYIKIRVDLINYDKHIGRSKIFVMSFHFSEIPFSNQTFPYRNKENG